MAKSTPTRSRKRPRVLVLESLSASSRAITRAGAVAITADPTRGAKRTLDLIESTEWDGLLLTGGSDVDPRRYGVKRPHREVYGVNEIRDEVEAYALACARERGLPVLGICRGCQLINVEAGGTLHQHIGEKHRNCWHPVTTKGGSVLAVAAGDQFRVRSLHHQKIRQPAPGYRVVARAHDLTPEAIESDDGRCLGVQFHPELDTGRAAQGIFRWLALESARRAGLSEPAKRKTRATKKKKTSRQMSFSDGYRWLDSPPPPLGDYLHERTNRQAGTRQFRTAKRNGSLTVSWFCPTCAIRFDNQDDRTAHMAANVCGHP